jgi:hypothetical protein
VSSHPAFPVIVAVWFAALLAIGSMVLPLALFESLAIASQLADSFAAAQPPFGSTARIAVAIVAGVLGALAGLFVARQVAAAQARNSARARAKPPISAHDELGEGGLDAADDDEFIAPREEFTGRRRALAQVEESDRHEFVDLAPLPGQSLDEDDPLDLEAFEEPEEVVEVEPEYEAPAQFAQAEPDPEPDAVAREPAPELAPPVTERPLGELGMVELVERFATALQRHRERAEQPPAAEAASAVDFEERPLPVALQPFGFDERTNDEAGDDESAPDFDFAAALSRNGEAFAAAPEASEQLANSGVDAFEEEFEETAEAEYTSLLAMKSPLGNAREPVRIDAADSEEDDGENGFCEPVVAFPGHAGRRAAPGSGADSPQSFDAPLARAERAVVHGPLASPVARQTGGTERALRDALEKLQKLSGVG